MTRARDFRPTDRDACLAIFHSNVPDFFTAAERTEFEAFLNERPGPYLVIENETGEVIACGGYAVEAGTLTADFCWGMVRRDRQRSGFGRRLAEERLRRIRRDPAIRDVALRTSHDTRGFFERLGFAAERVVPDGIAPGVDLHEMRMVVAADPTDLRTFDGPGGPLAAADGGTGGTPVVFLHSLAGNSRQWAPQLAHVRRSRRAVALELRGHGRAELPADGDFSMRGYAADVAAAADGLGLDRFVLVAHSMGAAVAAAYAAARPERVVGLVLVDGAFAREAPTAAEREWLRDLGTDRYEELIEGHWTAILEGSRADVRERVLADLRATSNTTVVASFRRLVQHDPIPSVRAYTGPTTLVLSDIGDNPSAAHHHVEGIEPAFVRGTGHWLQLDRPNELNERLDRFLARHAPVG